jgi:sialate O-acetylesterase
MNRKYQVDGSLVKSGKNVIAVRVHSDKFAGGLHGPADRMHITCPARPQDPAIPLSGNWRYAIEANYGKVVIPEQPLGPESPHAPARLHHAMIRPLVPLTMRGVIWYQGESNATRALQYRTLSKLLVKDLREHWNDQELGFHLVQLANYMARTEQPPEHSNWALLREAQAMTLDVPNTGMAVTIDIGETNDIHPRNKQDVGLRLAHSALHHTYGFKDQAPIGPVFKQAVHEGKAIRIDFDHVWDGLHARDGKLKGFAIAGPDNKFVWADAHVQGDSVYVTSPKVADPKHVRYAWGDNPECNLYNGAGLPACPFRTDVD